VYVRGDFASFWRRRVDEDQNVRAKSLDKLKRGNSIRRCDRIKKADFLATRPAVSRIELNQRDRANPPQLFSKYDRIREFKDADRYDGTGISNCVAGARSRNRRR
jgi:hypothetical protein